MRGKGAEPLFKSVAAQLRTYLSEQNLGPGDVIEPERLLVERFGVSRITLRRAIDLLVDDHVLVRRQGLGTFVGSQRISYPVIGLHSTRDIAKAHGVEAEIKIVKFEVGQATSRERVWLDLPARARVVRFVRCDYLRGEPISVAECVIPARLANALSADELEHRSTYELIEASTGVRFTSARQTLRSEPAAGEVAGLLKVAAGRPLFVVERTSFGRDGVPLERFKIFYLHDYAECEMELSREPHGRLEEMVGAAFRYSGASDGDGRPRSMSTRDSAPKQR